MLQFIRERAQGLVAMIIILFLILTFALWGIDEYLRAARAVVVAEVNGEDIELGAYQQSFQRLRQRAQAQLGDQFDPALWTQDETKRQALDMLVEERLLQHTVDDARLRISAPQIAAFIRASDTFQVDGKFSIDRYRQAVNMLGFTEAGFEQQARQDLAVQQLRAGIALSAFATQDEALQLAQLFAQKRDVGYALLEPPKPETIEVSDADAEAYYKKNPDLFRVPEKLSLEYLELTIDELKKEISADEKVLTDYYEAHKDAYTTQEQRAANHILVQVKKGATEAEDAAARAKIEALRKDIEGGASFEEVAKQQSDDIGSRAEGGDTGLFPKGVMAPEFEQAAFSLPVGELSQPVKTEFGYHLIRVREIKPGGIEPFEAVHAQVDDAYRREQAENLYFERAEAFSDAVTEHPDALDAAAETLHMKVETTEPMTREEIEARFSKDVANAAWEPEVLTDGLVSVPVEIDNTRVAAVKVAKHAPTHVPDFAAIKADVLAALRDERGREAARKRGDAVAERLRKGEAVEAVVAAEQLEWHEAKGVSRDTSELNRAVARAAFQAPLQPGGEPAIVGVPLGTGAFAVARVTNQQIPTAEQLAGKNVDAIRRDVARSYMAAAWRAYIDGLRADAEVKTFPERL